MSEPEWPKKWFRVTNFGTLMSDTFERETDHSLVKGKARVKKRTGWYQWFPTKEEASIELERVRLARATRSSSAALSAAVPELAACLAELAEARARIAVLDQVAHNFRDMLEAHCDNTGEQLEPDDKALFDAWKATLAGKETP
jgi:hypothetical protein